MKKLLGSLAKVSLVGFATVSAVQLGFAQQPFQPLPQPGTVAPGTVAPGQPVPGQLPATLDTQGAAGPVFRGSMIIGSPVDMTGGAQLGTVQDLVLAPTGCLEYAVVAYQNQFIPIPWDLVNFEPGRRILQVNIDAARIRELPMVGRIGDIENHQFVDRVHTFYRGDHGFRRFNRGEQGRVMERGVPGRTVGPNRAAPPAGTRGAENRGPDNRGERR